MGQLVLNIAGLLAVLYVKDSLAINLLPEHCGQSFENRIYGGSTTNIGEYPWVALIEYTLPDNTKEYSCGGSLINNRYVLTAGHCINFDPGYGNVTGIRLGEWDTTTDPDCQVLKNGAETCADPVLFVGIEQFHLHPNFNYYANGEIPYLYSDIALLRLNRSIEFTNFIQPICLPIAAKQRSKLFDGIAMQFAGWGFTEEGTRSTVKKKATLKGVDFESCSRKHSKSSTKLVRLQMCASGHPGKATCKYDSGGPLMAKESVGLRDVYVLVGILSFGPRSCGSFDTPDVYSRVGAFMQWIESVLRP